MTKKALTLALEALEKERPYLGAMPALTSKAITAIKEALSELEQDDEVLGFNGWGFPIEKPSQPEQRSVRTSVDSEHLEPVAWIVHDRVDSDRLTFVEVKESLQTEVTPLYKAPPQRDSSATPSTWEGLSVFEINDLVENTEYEDYRGLVEETEAKLKEKNTRNGGCL